MIVVKTGTGGKSIKTGREAGETLMMMGRLNATIRS
jgi:hypothetical protein